MSTLPPRPVVVAGTATEIGKTWVAVHLIEALRARGIRTAARKPVQSFESHDEPTDADLLAAASGESPYDVCPAHRWYALALAPPMAAEVLGEPPIALDDLVDEMKLPEEGLVLVEGVGGPRSPLADDGDTVELCEAIGADVVVLVGDAELGAINAIQLSSDAFRGRAVIVFLNRYDDARRIHQMNRDWLREVAELEVLTQIDELAETVVRVTGSTRSEGREADT